MWLSGERRQAAAKEAAAESGPVTVLGRETAVCLAGERRNVALCAPGGLIWRPKLGQQVLVLKTGQDGQTPFILGQDVTRQAQELAPGDVVLGTGEGQVRCGEGIELTGSVTVNGESLEQLILRVTAPEPVVGG